MHLPRLFKKTSTGAIQEWSIRVYQPSMNSDAAEIETMYGQLDSDKIQTTTDLIYKGKNVGKKNETTPFEQACAEAKSKWEKQKKKGYVETLTDAKAGNVDALIEGGVNPMLAHKFSEQGHKIVYPAMEQPKLDGIRCVAIHKDGKCTLWSRTRKPIYSMPHIVDEIERVYKDQDVILDGELYNHAYRNNFEHIVSLVRQEEPAPNCTDVEYHIYDQISEGPFAERIEKVYTKLHCYEKAVKLLQFIRTVSTIVVRSESQALDVFEHFREHGYEGAMLRNLHGKYANKRSYDLQKVKEFDEDEFPVVGIEEGRGKLVGHVGSFVCRTPSGKEFLAKMSGDTSRLRDYFLDHSLWQGKMLSVQYQGLTGAEGVPRFPVGKAFRDYE